MRYLRAPRFPFLLACLGLLALAPQAAASEPFFPHTGSRAYDAGNYHVQLAYQSKGRRIRATTTITAVAKRQLSGFSFDFFGPRVSQVRVDGEAAKLERRPGKLDVLPGELIAKGETFVTEVRYAGKPPTITDPDGSQEGWYPTDDGVLAVGEPQGTAAWIPCNNIPADKASFSFDITVPDGLKAVANGRLQRSEDRGGFVHSRWVEPAPMSSYLAVLDIGRGRIVKTRVGKLPAWTLVDPRMLGQSHLVLAELPRIVRFESHIFGSYPFDSAGSIVDYAPKLGYALESQSRPIYAFVPDITTVVHETAHQWFGDSVGLKRWPDIWLNEGFATWTQWYYAERHGRRSARAIFKRLYRVPASNKRFWNPPPGHPGSPRFLFDPTTYVRGAMALEALRLKIGTKPMLRVLRTWAEEHRHGSGDIEEFIAVADQVSGRDLDPLFHRWLYRRGKPEPERAHPLGTKRAARPVVVKPPPPVRIGHASLGTAADGHAVALVPVTYPIQLAGHRVPVQISVLDSASKPIESRQARILLSAGRLRRPERRRSFTFVHRLDLWGQQPQDLQGGVRVRVQVRGRLDVNDDGKPELQSGNSSAQPLSLNPSGAAVCSTVPAARTRPGRRTMVQLPACTSPVQWHVAKQPQHGSAHIEEGSLVYRSGPRFRGTDTLTLGGGQEVRFTVGASGSPVVRAIGDSVTAGFGYYSNGASMTIGHLFECEPPEKEFNDACSSNSLTRDNEAKLEYAPDYGLANNVSWAAQWANANAVTNYENLAVSGAEPASWAPGGYLHPTTARVESEDPEYILMTVGANPLLSEMLFGIDHMGCAIYAQVFGNYRECIEEAFAEVKLHESLKRLYTDLVEHTSATIYLMQYHLSVPSIALAYSATQIAEMGKLLNQEIAAVAAEVNPNRLQVVTPPHFNVGIDVSPVYPSRFSCSRLGYKVDGPSVQSTPTQTELKILHPLSFCKGPAGGGPPWVISGDTGIHPSAAGYAQMASQVPPPSG
jgi:lysophospholipase L1-like esterase